MSLEAPTPNPEAREIQRRKRLSEIRNMVIKFAAAGLLFQATVGGVELAKRYREHLRVATEVENVVGKNRSILEAPVSAQDKARAEKEFDADFQFEYEQLAHFREVEKNLRVTFGAYAPSQAAIFQKELDAARNYSANITQDERSRLKLQFEELFYPRVVEEERHTNVEAIQLQDGMVDQETMRAVINTFPRNWINGEIGSIELARQAPSVTVIDGVSWKTVADFRKQQGEKITVYDSIKESSFDNFTRVLAHESAHANDWNSSKRTSYEERLELLTKVTGRISAPDRFVSAYAESTLHESDNREFNACRHAQEYWAEICAQYFEDPTQLSVDDFELVDGWVKKGDPQYNPVESHQHRTELLLSVAREAGPGQS